jgi:hypothetical protein
MVTRCPVGQGTGYTKHRYLNTESKQDIMCWCPLYLTDQQTVFGTKMEAALINIVIINEIGIESIDN